MKRRQAIRNIAIATAAAYLLPQCKNEPAVTGPVYPNLPLDEKQRKLVEQFAEALLPKAKTQVKTPETTADFILTVLNDCHSPEDIQKYVAGLTELQAHVQQKYKADFGSLGADKHTEIFSYLSSDTGPSEPLKFFYDKTRGMTIEHFTSSEFFMKNVMKWEFAPGYFRGCVTV
ncbi:MAG: gluconate 2-dehydrogenase subunit 3 family protein [Saprospiraceae bacterium]|nr:gluconate 2-dehydrogenase subunit 3 family protein [Saprospiraceae bacterium]